MICSNCKKEKEEVELWNGRCLHCLGDETVKLRLFASHTVMAIESGTPVPGGISGLPAYQQTFGQRFLERLKSVLF